MIFADLKLSQRIEAAETQSGVDCAKTMARLRPESGAGAEPVAGGYAIFTGVNSPVTQAIGLGLHGPVSATEIEQLEHFYRSRGDAVRVELCPHADPSLFEHFGRRGYRTVEVSNVLVRPLQRSETWPGPAAGITVERVPPEDAALWTRTVAQGFAEHFPVTPEILEVTELFFHTPEAQCFLARINGEPAGGAAFAVHDGIAGVYGASTLPAFRKRGVQTALLHARLAIAAAAGCDLAHTITQVGSASQRNVERCDFRVVYTRSKFQRDWTSAQPSLGRSRLRTRTPNARGASGLLREALADEFNDVLRGCARQEDLGDAHLFEAGGVGVGNRAAENHGDVLHPFLAQQLHEPRAERVVRAAQDGQTDDVHVLLLGCGGDHLRRLPQAGVNHFHAGVAQRPGNDLRAAVLAGQARLGHQHPNPFLRHRSERILQKDG